MIIDTHAHFVPASFVDEARAQASRFPSVKITMDENRPRFQFAGGTPTRPMSALLSDTKKRGEWMSAQGIDKQVVGGWLDMFGYELPVSEGVAWSELFNRHMVAAYRENPNLVPLASVPLQDGTAAGEMLRDVMKSGFSGAMIGAQPKGIGGNLDDPGLDPFWQAASDTGAALIIHPMYACPDVRVNDYGMINAVGRAADVTIAVARLLYSGHMQRFPGAKVIVSTGGGALPFMLGRLKRNAAIHPNTWADPEDSFRRLYFDSILFDPNALQYLINMVGADKVVPGSDYPFPIGDPEPMQTIRKSGVDSAAVKKICETNPAAMFNIR